MSATEFSPKWCSAPGDTIKELFMERGISLEELATDLELTRSDVDDLLEGRLHIGPRLAEKLEYSLGGTSAFWQNRERQYRTDWERLHGSPSDEDRYSWLAKLPVRDM